MRAGPGLVGFFWNDVVFWGVGGFVEKKKRRWDFPMERSSEF